LSLLTLGSFSSFPFLNFIGVFVAAALGADYVFVTVDKWKNARIENPSASTEDIAAIALPDAASAMFLTTSTTAVAFFATTICPVTPILCFALYCGLLIVFNYFMNILFLFPALCLYDNSLGKGKRNYLCNFFCCSKSIFENTGSESNEEGSELSTIHKVLNYYFLFLKKFRYAILVLCLIGTGICVWIAFTVSIFVLLSTIIIQNLFL
jgi:predicted RND superfamily exporter protein